MGAPVNPVTNTTRTKETVVSLENKPGTLAEVSRALAQANVNILGVTLDVVSDFGIARFITADAAKAQQTLQQKGLKVVTNEVLTLKLPNKPGALAEATEKLARSGINIEAVTGFTPTGTNEGTLVFKVDDIAQAEKILGQ